MTSAINWAKEHRRELMAAFAVLAVVVLVVGLCLSWFVHGKSLSTVGEIKDPAELKLMGPNGTAMTEIDLTYEQKDVDKNGNVTLKKPFCVKSDKPQTDYSLMLAHTTNIKGLDIKLYKAEAKENPSASDTTADVAGVDRNERPFAWNKVGEDLLTQGSYINKADTDKADTDHDAQTFGSELGLDDLERSASPLYWKLSGQNTGGDCLDDYIIEFKWQETQKETDVFYLIALT